MTTRPSWVLDRIDPTQRLTHVVPAATIEGAEMRPWRTRREQNEKPGSYSMNMNQKEHRPVSLSPPHRPRAALKFDTEAMVEDLLTLLKRQGRG